MVSTRLTLMPPPLSRATTTRHCLMTYRPKGRFLADILSTNHGNGSLSETVLKKNEFTRQLAVFEGNCDNEMFIFILRPFHTFNLTF